MGRIAKVCQLSQTKMDQCLDQAIADLHLSDKQKNLAEQMFKEGVFHAGDEIFNAINLIELNQYGAPFVEKVLLQVILPITHSLPFNREKAQLLHNTIVRYGLTGRKVSRLFNKVLKKNNLKLE